MPDPIVNKYLSLSESERFRNKYIDRYDIQSLVFNPLIQVVPALQLDTEGKIPGFFGPYVLNIIAFTGPYVNNALEWDTASVEECKAVLVAAYPSYACYETHIMIDADSQGAQDASTEQMDATASLSEALCTDLSEYGFTWQGSLSAGDLDAKINEILEAFNERLKLL